jgi:uncharacterized protein (DUF4415 family)
LYYGNAVTPSTRRVTTFRIDDDLLEAMEHLKVRDGIPYSEQIRRALRGWLDKKGVTKTKRPRVPARKRS